VLGKFFGRDSKPSLPKNQIEVVCPVCGAAQVEPRLVVTTLCRKCGEHLRIEKNRVVASSHINPVPSAVYPAVEEAKMEEDAERKKAAATSKADDGPRSSVSASASAPSSRSSSAAPASASAPTPVKQTEDAKRGEGEGPESSSSSPAAERPPASSARDLFSRQVSPAQPAPAPQPASPAAGSTTLQKMREKGHNQQYFKEAECFECHHKFKVGRAAKNTNCPSCGASVCLEDFDINLVSTMPIVTRGEVLIRKTGNVQTSIIKCRDLKLYGSASAKIDCTGTVTLRTIGTVIGEIHCHRFVVERGSDVNLMNTVYADEVEIGSRTSGNIECHGKMVITATGLVHGDVATRSISIEPGGQLDGAMNILRSNSERPPSDSEHHAHPPEGEGEGESAAASEGEPKGE